jgi:hypothetical protein
MRHFVLSLALVMTTTIAAAPPAPPPPAPILFVKVQGPEGMVVTFHPGSSKPQRFETPVTVGFRPGYVYRLELALPSQPKLKVFPTLEVRGALQASIDQAMRHPVPLVFSQDDLQRIDQAGAMVTKVHFLEDPLQAQPVATRPDEPLVVEVPAMADPLFEARLRGRLMLIARFGEREPTPEELARTAVPNTILFPGDQRLGVPPVLPSIPWLHVPIFDPILGAKRGTEECLPDGGDTGLRVGIGPENRLGGLEPSDTAAEYNLSHDRKRTSVSNRVCVFGPRFGVIRQETVPAGSLFVQSIGEMSTLKSLSTMAAGVRAGTASATVHTAATVTRKSLSSAEGLVKLHGFDNIKNLQIVGSIAGVQTLGGVKEPDEIASHPFSEPISLFKWAEPREARPGDIVTYYLRYKNHTREFVENLAVTDSLIPRLEYIVGSSRTDREMVFTVTENEVGSVTLRWELTGKLPPGGQGVISFQVRVR